MFLAKNRIEFETKFTKKAGESTELAEDDEKTCLLSKIHPRSSKIRPHKVEGVSRISGLKFTNSDIVDSPFKKTPQLKKTPPL